MAGAKQAQNSEIKAKIRRGEPIQCRNLVFYPIKMAQYEEFLEVQGALLLRMTSLPVQYLAMPFLSALWALDWDTYQATGKIVGLFERVIHFLYLSLRLGYERADVLKKIQFANNGQDFRTIRHIEVEQDGKSVKITPQEFTSYYRPLMAQLNGLELPDESFNPELVKAEKDLASLQSLPLDYNIDDMLASVAYQSGLANESEMDEWTVYQFERRRNAIERDKRFMLYGQAELSGMVKFKKGNPFPSWCFNRAKGMTRALRTVDDVNQNVKAIGNIAVAVNKSGVRTQTTKST